ncbi:MAG TPA: CBS domain-containing protein [Acidimicrobiales bacterium]|nr:CBS domain-containing protein [Acidimicrobiales bacterium]
MAKPSIPSLPTRRHHSGRPATPTPGQVLRQGLISVAGLVGARVTNQAGQEVGRLVDVVARVRGGADTYPPISGIVLRVGGRRTYLDAGGIARVEVSHVALSTARVDLREFRRRPGEVLLARDLLDHQLVDVDGVQVIRAADLYLAAVAGTVRLVGVDVSLQTLLRRLGPRRLRTRPTPDRVIDWAAVEPFGDDLVDTPAAVRLRSPQSALRRLRPGELADLLEDLGRAERQALLASLDPETAADALEEMEADELEVLLREADPEQAAALVEAMEPDEAVDALRELAPDERDELLDHMSDRAARQLTDLLEHPADEAAGFMTSTLARVHPDDEVAVIVARLRDRVEQRNEIDAVVVVDGLGHLLADIPLFDVLVADPSTTFEELMVAERHHDPVTVAEDAGVEEVASRLIESRRSSVLVVDPDRRPVGRILADDVLDALSPGQGRLHFPRLLQ